MFLNCHTYYSLRYGTFSVEALCGLAQKFEVKALALTDINNTSACMNLLKMAPEYGIKPLVGIDFRNGAQQQYVGLARNNNGFRNLNEHLSATCTSKKTSEILPRRWRTAILFIRWSRWNFRREPPSARMNL
jgi:DNA polymerase III alpha subunit